jgi:hypothetical protein
MSIEATVYDRLNDTSITDIVASRIYPTDPAANTDWPFLVYLIEDTAPVTSISGATSLNLYTVQVDIWAKSLQQLKTLAAAVRSRLHCYRGGTVQRSALTDETNEQLADENIGDVYHRNQTYSIWANE